MNATNICVMPFHFCILLTFTATFYQQVTREVIHEFAADNVKYLELRSTPRAVSSNGMTKTSYVEAILRAIGECHSEQDLDITVRLLLSIDRRCPISDAVDTVNLAAEYMHKTGGIIIGIDLSGDPMVSCSTFGAISLSGIARILQRAFHCGHGD